MHKYKNMKQTKAAILPFTKMSNFSSRIIFMDIKGPIYPASEGNYYIDKSVDHFRNHIGLLPTPKNIASCAVIF